MCLAIPGQILEVVDEANRLALVDVAGVRRNVNIGLLDEDGGARRPGDWVLIHVGFAISKVDEEEAIATRKHARGDGRRLRAGARGAEGERDRVTLRDDEHCVTCGDVAEPMTVLEDRRGARAGALRGRAGEHHTVEIALVQPVAEGDELLVHAGTAIA